jgi:ribosomal protein S18 acetylase RimI-like enzyme
MQAGYQIREPRTEAEWKHYYNLRFTVLIKPWDPRVDAEKDSLEDSSIHRMIIDDNNNIVACARLQFNSQTEAQIRYIAVDESCRRMGLASQIIVELETIAKEKGAEEMLINARENALALYERLGYKIIKESYLMFGEIKHQEMRKAL